MPSKSPNQYTGKNPSKFPQARLRDDPPTEKPYLPKVDKLVKVGHAPTGPEPIPEVQVDPTLVVPIQNNTTPEKTKRRKDRYKE
jgi:hypothetical protein